MTGITVIACEKRTGIVLDTHLRRFIQADGQKAFRQEFDSLEAAATRCTMLAHANPDVEFWIEEQGKRKRFDLPTRPPTVP